MTRSKYNNGKAVLWVVSGGFLSLMGGSVIASPENFLGGVVFLVAGIFMIRRGYIMLKRLSSFSQYKRIIGDKTIISLRELSQLSGVDEEVLKKDLGDMVRNGIIKGSLINYGKYFKTDKYIESEPVFSNDDEDNNISEVHHTVKEGRNYILVIRKANNKLSEGEISAKLDKLERTVEGIFNYVELHPEKIPDIRRLMEHHLPMTLKLVNTYQDISKLGIDKGEFSSVKADILKALDAVNEAFGNLMASLFQDVAIDVSTDIKVLKTILTQDGLLDENGFKLKSK